MEQTGEKGKYPCQVAKVPFYIAFSKCILILQTQIRQYFWDIKAQPNLETKISFRETLNMSERGEKSGSELGSETGSKKTRRDREREKVVKRCERIMEEQADLFSDTERLRRIRDLAQRLHDEWGLDNETVRSDMER